MAEDKNKVEEKEVEKVLEEEKLAVLAPIMKSIQIALDGYDDIFSDFDSSPYSSRVLSDDFLKEIRKRYYENKKGDFELNFMLQAARRDQRIEATIKRRLKDFFKSEMDYFHDKKEKIKRGGVHRIGVGFILLSLEVVLSVLNVSDLYVKVLNVLLVPAGWYAFYSGFEYIFEDPKELESQFLFNEKLYKAKYEFISEEELLKASEQMLEQKTQK